MLNASVNCEKTPQQIEGLYDDSIGTIYRASGNLFIAKECCKATPKIFEFVTRSEIKCFSSGSGMRMRRYLRECIPEYQEMLTLTYPGAYPINGRIVKNHLRRFLQEVKREWCRMALIRGLNQKDFSAFWFLEFQHRGAPHFHVFLTWAPRKEWIAKRWYDIVASDDERHLHAGTRIEFLRSGRAGTISYASKYAAKMEQKEVPAEYSNVGRWWGIVGRRSTVSAATWVTTKDLQKTNVQRALTVLISAINRFLYDGSMEVIVNEPGTRVFSSNNQNVMREIRIYVGRLAATVFKWENIFDDADIEN